MPAGTPRSRWLFRLSPGASRAIVAACVFAYGVFVSSLVAVESRPVAAAAPGWYEISAGEVPASDYFDAGAIARGKRYRAARLGFQGGFLALEIAFWGLLLATGAARRLAAQASRVTGERFWLTALVFFVALFVLRQVWSYPLALVSRAHRVDAGLSTQSAASWHLDWLLASGGSAMLGALGFALAYVVSRRLPRLWWLVVGTGAAALIVIGSYVWPVVVAPIFNRFEELADGELRTRLVEMAERYGIDVDAIVVMDASRRSPHTNAYFAGVGATRRIVLYDTLLAEHTDDEVVAVLAHEIGHWRGGHVPRGIAWGAFGTFGLLFLVDRALAFWSRRGPSGVDAKHQLAGAPVFLLVVTLGNVFTLPIQNAISRQMEREADDFELAATGDPRLLISGMQKMALRNLADVEPHPLVEWVFSSHPSTMARIRRALAEERRRGIE